LLRPGSASSIVSYGEDSAVYQKNRSMSIGWQLLEGVMALFASVALTWWIFVAPSRAKRERRRLAREMKDPRQP
jgi:hypothetical protein